MQDHCALCSNLMGKINRRPEGFPKIDRAALMRDAHRVARSFRQVSGSYRQALAYGLWAAWKSAKSRQHIRSLAVQAARPAVPFTAAQLARGRQATRQCGSSLWAA